MILYFSATGNNKYIAEQVANAIGDRAISILEVDFITLEKGEKLGFVFPTYFWRLPTIVDEYIKKLLIKTKDPSHYIYFISTYGTTCGGTGTYIKRHLKKKELSLSAAFSIKTVDNWTVWFDLSDKTKINATLENEAAQLKTIISKIKENSCGNQMKNTLPEIAFCGSGLFYNKARKTKHFNVSNTCIGCGLCEKICPTNAIEIQNNKPVWVKDQCTLCLGCLHRCPKFAIHYDNKTLNHGQYMHP